MRMTIRSGMLGLCVAGTLACVGCGSSKAARYYMLSASAQRVTPAAGHVSPRMIRVGPVRLPAYLDRQQMVSRVTGNAIKIAQYDRWAEPLQDGVLRVLVSNLSALLPNDQVQSYSSANTIFFDYRIGVDIRRLDGVPGGTAELVAHWTIRADKGQPTLRQTEGPLTIPVADSTYDALARAESELLARLSLAIAADLNNDAGSTHD